MVCVCESESLQLNTLIMVCGDSLFMAMHTLGEGQEVYDIRVLIAMRPYMLSSQITKPTAVNYLLQFEIYSDQCSVLE